MLVRHFLSRKAKLTNPALNAGFVRTVLRPIKLSTLMPRCYSTFNKRQSCMSYYNCARFMNVKSSISSTCVRGFATTDKPTDKVEANNEMKAEQKFERQKDQTIEDFLKARREFERKQRKALTGKVPKITAKLKSVARDYKELLNEDIKQKNFKLINWKFKEFMSRNHKKFKLLMKHIWHELKIIGKGFVTLKQDLTYSIKTTKDTALDEYGSYSFESRIRIRRTWADLFKFIPFSLFIIVPGLELLLPAWLIIFPNSIPSQFISEASKKQKMDELVKKQEMSSKKLVILLPKILSEMTKDSEIDNEDQERIKKLITLIKDPNMSITSLLEYRDLFNKYIDFRVFPISSLEACCSFMSLQPKTGRVSWLSKYFLHREIKMYMKKLRDDDSAIMYKEIESLDESALNRLCFERGIPISIMKRDKKLSEFKKWHTLSNLRNVSDSLLLFSRVIRFNSASKTEDLKLDEYQILKRCPNEIYYYEKQKVFEETLSLDELKTLIGTISRKYENDDTQFSAADLDNYAQLLGKLRERFTQLNQEIEDTFRVGNEIDEYIENRIIIQYFLECKLDEFEKKYPSLVDRAKVQFGSEFYYSIPNDKEQLMNNQKIFAKIIERRTEIEEKLHEVLNIMPPKVAEVNQ